MPTLTLALVLLLAMPAQELARVRELENSAHALQKAGRYREAEAPLLQAIAVWTRHRGAGDVEVLNDRMNLAVSYRRRGEAARAVPILESVATQLAASKDPDAPGLHRQALNNLAVAYIDTGKPAQARTALETCRRLLRGAGPSAERARVLDHLSSVSLELGDALAAERHARLGLREWQALAGDHAGDVAISRAAVGTALMRQGQLEPARVELAGSLASIEQVFPAGHPQRGAVLNLLGELELRARRPALARAHFQRALTLLRARLTEDHPLVREARLGLERATAAAK